MDERMGNGMIDTVESLKAEVLFLHRELAEQTLLAESFTQRLNMKNRECNDRAMERMFISEQLRTFGLQLGPDGKVEKKV